MIKHLLAARNPTQSSRWLVDWHSDKDRVPGGGESPIKIAQSPEIKSFHGTFFTPNSSKKSKNSKVEDLEVVALTRVWLILVFFPAGQNQLELVWTMDEVDYC